MFERFSPPARQVLVVAQEEARSLGHRASAPSTCCSGCCAPSEGVAARRARRRSGSSPTACASEIVELVGQGEAHDARPDPVEPADAAAVRRRAARGDEHGQRRGRHRAHRCWRSSASGEGAAAQVLSVLPARASCARRSWARWRTRRPTQVAAAPAVEVPDAVSVRLGDDVARAAAPRGRPRARRRRARGRRRAPPRAWTLRPLGTIPDGRNGPPRRRSSIHVHDPSPPTTPRTRASARRPGRPPRAPDPLDVGPRARRRLRRRRAVLRRRPGHRPHRRDRAGLLRRRRRAALPRRGAARPERGRGRRAARPTATACSSSSASSRCSPSPARSSPRRRSSPAALLFPLAFVLLAGARRRVAGDRHAGPSARPARSRGRPRSASACCSCCSSSRSARSGARPRAATRSSRAS